MELISALADDVSSSDAACSEDPCARHWLELATWKPHWPPGGSFTKSATACRNVPAVFDCESYIRLMPAKAARTTRLTTYFPGNRLTLKGNSRIGALSQTCYHLVDQVGGARSCPFTAWSVSRAVSLGLRETPQCTFVGLAHCRVSLEVRSTVLCASASVTDD
jgi:hypothetical protein